MRLIHLVILIEALLGSFQAAAQSRDGTIRGIVVDSVTQEHLPFANIFINNTSIGTSADADGAFVLKNVPPGQTDLVFSYVGYKSFMYRMSITEGLDVDVGLVPLAQMNQLLSEVEVHEKRDKNWEKKYRQFERVFLGENANSSRCKIVNPWVVEFLKGDNRSVLRAVAASPIEIVNYGLGYRIFFSLNQFYSSPTEYSILGHSRFEEAEPLDAKQAARWRQNRIDTYYGSDRHLFNSILENRTEEEGFRLYTDRPGFNSSNRSDIFANELGATVIPYEPDHFAGSAPDQFFVSLPARLEVHYLNSYANRKVYKDVPFEVSWLEVTNRQLAVNSDGVVLNPAELVVSGDMSKSRVADLLPFDYQPFTQVGNVQIHSVAKLSGWNKYKRMQEYAYVQTDKPYYGPGERIWLKAYMKYRDPELLDSLSKTLYVELINEQKVAVKRVILKIDSAMATGYIPVADSVRPGNYYLRAYTNWMRNYGSENFYVKPLPIIDPAKRVTRAAAQSDSSAVLIQFTADKTHYVAGDSVTLELTLTKEITESKFAAMAVSVTDDHLVTVLPNQPTIMGFEIPDEMLVSKPNFTVTYPMERGIRFSGTFLGKKGKPTRGRLSVIQPDFNLKLPVRTNSRGAFAVEGLDFCGVKEFGFLALDKKGRSYGSVRLDEKNFPPVDFDVKPLSVDFEPTTAQPQEKNLLEATSSKDFQASLRDGSEAAEGLPDYVVMGSELQKSNAGENLIQALKGRIPGLIVTFGWDDNDNDTYRIRLRPKPPMMNQAVSSTEPMLILDGVPMIDDPGKSIADYLRPIPISSVERVEVYTKGIPLFRSPNGAILVYTHPKEVAASVPAQKAIDSDLQTFPIEGYQQGEAFSMRAPYAGSLPAFSKYATILWVPRVNTNKTGIATIKFRLPLRTTTYNIVAEGMTRDGQPVRGVFKLEVQ